MTKSDFFDKLRRAWVSPPYERISILPVFVLLFVIAEKAF